MCPTEQLFLTYFRSLIDHDCTVDVELKNSIVLTGKLRYVDNNMCLLLDMEAEGSHAQPQLRGLDHAIYIRGSAIRAVYMPKIEADVEVLTQLCKS